MPFPGVFLLTVIPTAVLTSFLVCSTFLFSTLPAKAQDPKTNQPVFLMVHGTFQWAGQWQPLTEILEGAGYEVIEASLTGLGEKEHLLSKETGLLTHILDVSNMLSWRDLENVILVSHSYGGPVISGVAAQQPDRVKHLVFIDTVPLDHGENLIDGFGPDVYDTAKTAVDEEGDGWLIPSDALREAKPTMRPHPWKSYVERIDIPEGTPDFDGTIIVATEGEVFDHMRNVQAPARAERRGWSLVTVEGPHQLMEVSPSKEAVSEILLGIATN
ncbi:alpha/beta fold hydrolase [Tropicimonas sp. TH_r6]|uniref:alpha/beta fold hydrolase n=1 Tax=Tropicimonas sp. TH_r6 TaxID=3082085 RepID=UPI0029547D20|nr:alpha/beta fold hydrolase [Tropicimonas sp. TH_r6]MDV7145626.1 alpha/beta fold hydrolase [Tropicimonas sp. TH_r6]